MITEKRKQIHKQGPISAVSKNENQAKKEIKPKPGKDHLQSAGRYKKDIDAERHPEEQVVDPKAFPKIDKKVFR